MPYVTKVRGVATTYCEVAAQKNKLKRGDASKTRRNEHGAGSVLGVRDQDARNCNDVLRSIYVFQKEKK